jgi:hypothetical protein
MVEDRSGGTATVYEIRVRGIIGTLWSAWFDDLEIVPLQNGETLLAGPVADQAALHGILARIRDLNLPLVSITSRRFDQTEDSQAPCP